MNILNHLKFQSIDDLRERMDEGEHLDGKSEQLIENIGRKYVPQYHKELEGILDEFLVLLNKRPSEGPPVGEATPMTMFVHNIHEEVVNNLREVFEEVQESRDET